MSKVNSRTETKSSESETAAEPVQISSIQVASCDSFKKGQNWTVLWWEIAEKV
jgi:hypothetical protein